MGYPSQDCLVGGWGGELGCTGCLRLHPGLKILSLTRDSGRNRFVVVPRGLSCQNCSCQLPLTGSWGCSRGLLVLGLMFAQIIVTSVGPAHSGFMSLGGCLKKTLGGSLLPVLLPALQPPQPSYSPAQQMVPGWFSTNIKAVLDRLL